MRTTAAISIRNVAKFPSKQNEESITKVNKSSKLQFMNNFYLKDNKLTKQSGGKMMIFQALMRW